jgi:drug/metabolite transporter (DMT)-like permease
MDKLILTRYGIEPEVYLGIIQIFISINFFILISIFHNGLKGVRNGLAKAGWLILIVSVLTVTHRLLYLEALADTNIGLVSSVKRLSVLFTVILGGAIFHESNIKRKLFAVIVMLFGVLFLI